MILKFNQPTIHSCLPNLCRESSHYACTACWDDFRALNRSTRTLRNTRRYCQPWSWEQSYSSSEYREVWNDAHWANTYFSLGLVDPANGADGDIYRDSLRPRSNLLHYHTQCKYIYLQPRHDGFNIETEWKIQWHSCQILEHYRWMWTTYYASNSQRSWQSSTDLKHDFIIIIW
jgi:hypothetical protein